jgi:hypothetical protein
MVKHLPWYNDYIKNNFTPEELDYWKNNNKSSLILSCVKL